MRKIKDWLGRARIRGRIEARGKPKDKKKFQLAIQACRHHVKYQKGEKMSLGYDSDSYIVYIMKE